MELLEESEDEVGRCINLPHGARPAEGSDERRAALKSELSKFGLQLLPKSMLCRDFIDGRLSDDVKEGDVAQVMAGMRYMNEYSTTFAKELDRIEDRIEACVSVLRRRNGGKFYNGIHGDACELVYGHGVRHYNEVRRHLYTIWSEFPERWPWLDEPNFGYDVNSSQKLFPGLPQDSRFRRS